MQRLWREWHRSLVGMAHVVSICFATAGRSLLFCMQSARVSGCVSIAGMYDGECLLCSLRRRMRLSSSSSGRLQLIPSSSRSCPSPLKPYPEFTPGKWLVCRIESPRQAMSKHSQA